MCVHDIEFVKVCKTAWETSTKKSHKSYYFFQYKHPCCACIGWTIKVIEESWVNEPKTSFTLPEMGSDELEKYSLHTLMLQNFKYLENVACDQT